MSLTIKQWIERAVDVINRGRETPLLDSEYQAEPLLDIVLSELAQEYAADGQDFLLSRQVKQITFANGGGALTADVLQSCLASSSLVDPSDSRKEYSYCATIDIFSQTYDKRLGYYHVPSPGIIRVTEPGAVYSATAGLSGNRNLSTPCVWPLPGDAVTDIGLPGETESDVVFRLADAIQGTIQQEASA